MATAAQIEALRVLFQASVDGEAEFSSRDVARVFRADLMAALDAAGFEEALLQVPGHGVYEGWRYAVAPVYERSPRTARGVVALTNTSTSTAHAFPIGAVVLEHPSTGARYRNVDAIVLPKKGTRPADVAPVARGRIEAEDGGELGTTLATPLDLVTPIAGVSAAADGPVIGFDASTRPQLVTALRSSDPVSVAARAVRGPSLTFIANRARDHDGVISVAAPGGAISDADRDLLRVRLGRDATIGAAALRARSLVSATPVAVPVSYSMQIVDGGGGAEAPPTPDIEAAVAARLAEYFTTLPIGPSTIWRDALDTAIRVACGMFVHGGRTHDAFEHIAPDGSSSSNLVSLTVTAPAADVVLAAHQVATLGTITPTIIRS